MTNTAIDTHAATRGLLLRTGNIWLEQGDLRQAADVFLKINDQYPNSEESQSARTALLTIAQRYEQSGLLRLSLDILERLEEINA